MNWLKAIQTFRELNVLREETWAEYHHMALITDDEDIINLYENVAISLETSTRDLREKLWAFNPDLTNEQLFG